MSDTAIQPGVRWSGVVDPLVLVEVAAPDGSVLWLDQSSGALYESLLEPPLSGDELPDYVTLSPEAGVAVVQDEDVGGRDSALVMDPEAGAVYADTDFDELVGVSVPAPERPHDNRNNRTDSLVAATTENGIHQIGHGVYFVESTGAYYDIDGNRLTGPGTEGLDGDVFDPGAVLTLDEYQQLTRTTEGFTELAGGLDAEATLPDGTPYTNLAIGVTDSAVRAYDPDRWSYDETADQWFDEVNGTYHKLPTNDAATELTVDPPREELPPPEPTEQGVTDLGQGLQPDPEPTEQGITDLGQGLQPEPEPTEQGITDLGQGLQPEPEPTEDTPLTETDSTPTTDAAQATARLVDATVTEVVPADQPTLDATATFAAEPDLDIGTRPAESSDSDDDVIDPIAAAAAAAQQAADAAQNAADDPLGFGSRIAEGTVEGLASAAEQASDTVSESAQDAIEEVPDEFIPESADLAGYIEVGETIAGRTIDHLGDRAAPATEVANDASEFVSNSMDDAIERGAHVVDTVSSKVNDVADRASTRTGAIADKTGSAVGDTVDTVWTRTGAIADKTGSAVEDLAFGTGADDADGKDPGATPEPQTVEDQPATTIEATIIEMTVAEADTQPPEPETDSVSVRGTAIEPEGDDVYDVAAMTEGDDSDIREADDFDGF